MSKRPFILITNDDGIQAPGIKHLWNAMLGFADVAIVAPHSEKSGCGLSITWAKPLIVRPFPWEGCSDAWSVNGTPADCVKMACSVILQRKPDMVLSGVNCGSNAGKTVLYSGTIGGVIEATHKNIPGIAFSFSDFELPPLQASQQIILSIVQYFLQNPLPGGTLLNVTFPLNLKEGAKGFKIAQQGRGYWLEAPDRRLHPEGVPYYWLGGSWGACDEDPESDVALLDQGYITAVPIHIGNMTDREVLKNKLSIERMIPIDAKNLSLNYTDS